MPGDPMIEFDAEGYRTLINDIELLTNNLKVLKDAKADLEKAVFKDLEKGNDLTFDEFIFEVAEGRRDLTNPAGFEEKWAEFIKDNIEGADPKDIQGLANLIEIGTTYKGPTLAEINKMITENTFLRVHYEEAKAIFGYKEGKRVEKIKIKKEEPEGADA